MNRELVLRAAVLYVPLCAALLAGWVLPRRGRMFAACLLSLLWVLPALLALQRMNVAMGWWSYAAGGAQMDGMPLEVWLGWAMVWGLVPQLLWRRLALGWCVAAMVGLDVVAMPLCAPLVKLGPRWLVGELVAAGFVLLPALCIARWTLLEVRLGWRAALQVAMSGMVFLFLVPEVAFAMRGGGWWHLMAMSRWELQLSLLVMTLLALPGVSAVQEFVESGGGTPIPYDPPKRFVKSGVYRYCANPMQLSCAVVMLVWAVLLRNAWLLILPVVSVIYSAGIAAWDEAEDLEARFGQAWRGYRREVKAWRVRWRPYCGDAAAQVYLARGCGPCSELRRWIERRGPLGLVLMDAESLPAGSIRRMRYVPGDGSASVEGVRAVGRVLEHMNFGWAMGGAALRLPVLWRFVQMVMDAGGLGPRAVVADEKIGCAVKSDFGIKAKSYRG